MNDIIYRITNYQYDRVCVCKIDNSILYKYNSYFLNVFTKLLFLLKSRKIKPNAK